MRLMLVGVALPIVATPLVIDNAKSLTSRSPLPEFASYAFSFNPTVS